MVSIVKHMANSNNIDMTQNDRAEIRQMLIDILSGQTEEMKGRYNVIHANLTQIKEQTTKTNGRVSSLEKKVDSLERNDIEHLIKCPQLVRISNNETRLLSLENVNFSRKAIFKFIAGLWAVTLALVGIAITIIELTSKQ